MCTVACANIRRYGSTESSVAPIEKPSSSPIASSLPTTSSLPCYRAPIPFGIVKQTRGRKFRFKCRFQRIEAAVPVLGVRSRSTISTVRKSRLRDGRGGRRGSPRHGEIGKLWEERDDVHDSWSQRPSHPVYRKSLCLLPRLLDFSHSFVYIPRSPFPRPAHRPTPNVYLRRFSVNGITSLPSSVAILSCDSCQLFCSRHNAVCNSYEASRALTR